MTQEDLSDRVGKDRATVANYLRLLRLPDEIKTLLYNGSITMGHARAILSVEGRAGQVEAARKIIKGGLSVREAEKLARNVSRQKKTVPPKDAQIASLEEKLKKQLGTKVRIVDRKKKGGRIEIEYYSLEELDRLLEILL
jgi:ParB family chromosome partitioning protein